VRPGAHRLPQTDLLCEENFMTPALRFRIGNLFPGAPHTADKAAAHPSDEAQEGCLDPAGLTLNGASDTHSAADAYLSLRQAIDSFDQGNRKAGANQLGSFVNHVSALRGKKIDATLADELIAEAQWIINVVG
jgi:hypothetical protein